MIVKIDGCERSDFRKDTFYKFLKENTHSGVLSPQVELFKTVQLDSKSLKISEDDRERFRWIFSTFDLDRDGERVDPKGWNLDLYKLNPVILWSHDRYTPAIGYAENITFGENLSGDIVFNRKDTDEFGWSIGQRVKDGSLRCGSVGFQVDEVEFSDEKEGGIIYRKQSLLEFSICNIPANPFALRVGADSEGKSFNKQETQIVQEKKFDIFEFFNK